MKTSKLVIAFAILGVFTTANAIDVADFRAAQIGPTVEYGGYGGGGDPAFLMEARAAGFVNFAGVRSRVVQTGGATWTEYEDRRAYTFLPKPALYWVNGLSAATMQEACNKSGQRDYPTSGWTYRLYNQNGQWMCRMYTPWNSFWVQQAVWREAGPVMFEHNSAEYGIYYRPVDPPTVPDAAAKQLCLAECTAQKEKDDLGLKLSLIKMKATFTNLSYAGAVGGALLVSLVPFGKFVAPAAALATFMVAKEMTGDFLAAYQYNTEISNDKRFASCKEQVCGMM